MRTYILKFYINIYNMLIPYSAIETFLKEELLGEKDISKTVGCFSFSNSLHWKIKHQEDEELSRLTLRGSL